MIPLFPLPQVSPSVTPQSVRGGPLPQLLPRKPVSDLGQLLPEQDLIQPVLHQRVERLAGRGVTPCQIARAFHRLVSRPGQGWRHQSTHNTSSIHTYNGISRIACSAFKECVVVASFHILASPINMWGKASFGNCKGNLKFENIYASTVYESLKIHLQVNYDAKWTCMYK